MKELSLAIDVNLTNDHSAPNEHMPYQRMDKFTIRLTTNEEAGFSKGALIGRLYSKGHYVAVNEIEEGGELTINAIDRNPRTIDIAEDMLQANNYLPEEPQTKK